VNMILIMETTGTVDPTLNESEIQILTAYSFRSIPSRKDGCTI
jgi:hypothetical protein